MDRAKDLRDIREIVSLLQRLAQMTSSHVAADLERQACELEERAREIEQSMQMAALTPPSSSP